MLRNGTRQNLLCGLSNNQRRHQEMMLALQITPANVCQYSATAWAFIPRFPLTMGARGSVSRPTSHPHASQGLALPHRLTLPLSPLSRRLSRHKRPSLRCTSLLVWYCTQLLLLVNTLRGETLYPTQPTGEQAAFSDTVILWLNCSTCYCNSGVIFIKNYAVSGHPAPAPPGSDPNPSRPREFWRRACGLSASRRR